MPPLQTPSGKEWNLYFEKLYELYIVQNLSEYEVREIMYSVYHIVAKGESTIRKFLSTRGITKNNQSSRAHKKKGTRARARRDPKGALLDIVATGELIFKPEVQRPFAPRYYIPVERIIVAVGRYLASMFDPNSNKWKANQYELVAPERVESQWDRWERLSSQSHSIKLMLQAKEVRKAGMLFDSFLTDLEDLIEHHDPAFIVHFWQMCLCFYGTRERFSRDPDTSGFHMLIAFLEKLKMLLCTYEDERSNMHDLVRSLTTLTSNFSSKSFKETIRVGFYKTIEVLAANIGNGNAIVIYLLSNYYQHWSKQSLQGISLFNKARELWEHSLYKSSKHKIAALFRVAHVAHYIYAWRDVTEFSAQELLSLTRELPGIAANTPWNLTSLAFTFATQILVANSLRRSEEIDFQLSEDDNLEDSEKARYLTEVKTIIHLLDHAIELLRTRNMNHRVQAANFSWTLLSRYQRWEMGDNKAKEMQRLQSILGSIPNAEIELCHPCIKEIVESYIVPCEPEWKTRKERRKQKRRQRTREHRAQRNQEEKNMTKEERNNREKEKKRQRVERAEEKRKTSQKHQRTKDRQHVKLSQRRAAAAL